MPGFKISYISPDNFNAYNIANIKIGYNGKLRTVEIGKDNYDYGARMYNGDVGRFASVDPITNEYPELTPYQFASNTPIWCLDLDGFEGFVATGINGHGMVVNVESAGKINHTVSNWVSSKHQQGKINVKIAEQARQSAIRQGRLDGDGITWYTKGLLYIAPWWNSTATFSDANDGAVLMSGKNLDGTKANSGDYVTAGVGIVIPFVSGSAIRKLFKGASTGIGKEAVEGILNKVDNISSALDEKHIKAAVNDIFGNPVVINARTYDHLTEVKNALKGLGNQIQELNTLIDKGKLSDDVLKSAQQIRGTLQKKKDEINATLDNATKKANQQ